jgi:hypothetical protein
MGSFQLSGLLALVSSLHLLAYLLKEINHKEIIFFLILPFNSTQIPIRKLELGPRGDGIFPKKHLSRDLSSGTLSTLYWPELLFLDSLAKYRL